MMSTRRPAKTSQADMCVNRFLAKIIYLLSIIYSPSRQKAILYHLRAISYRCSPGLMSIAS
jgi:hypothetical protein